MKLQDKKDLKDIVRHLERLAERLLGTAQSIRDSKSHGHVRSFITNMSVTLDMDVPHIETTLADIGDRMLKEQHAQMDAGGTPNVKLGTPIMEVKTIDDEIFGN